MKKYNVENYIRYKDDIKSSMPEDKPYVAYTKDELIIKFLPLVEREIQCVRTQTTRSLFNCFLILYF